MASKRLTEREKLSRRLSRQFWHWIETGEDHPRWSETVERILELEEIDEDPGCGPECPCIAFDFEWKNREIQRSRRARN